MIAGQQCDRCTDGYYNFPQCKGISFQTFWYKNAAFAVNTEFSIFSQCITIVRLFLGQQEKKYQKLLLNQSVYSKTVHPRKILFTESRGSSRFCSNKVVSDFEFGDFLSKGRTNFNCVFWYFFFADPKTNALYLLSK